MSAGSAALARRGAGVASAAVPAVGVGVPADAPAGRTLWGERGDGVAATDAASVRRTPVEPRSSAKVVGATLAPMRCARSTPMSVPRASVLVR